jgi:hypothetical protein
MFTGFEKIVEERIRRAQRNGVFDDLPGSGQPIRYEDDHLASQELGMAYKILKNAGCLPPEIELKNEIRNAEDLLAGVADVAEKYRVIKKINFMIMKLNTMQGKSILSDLPQHYMSKLAGRIGSKDRHSDNHQISKKEGGHR